MAEQDLCCDIVQSGTWLYDNSVPTDVWIVRGDRRTLGPAKLSLREAVASAEELVTGQITWTNHLRQKLFGGRNYSLAPTE